jgi:hypothetical protein
MNKRSNVIKKILFSLCIVFLFGACSNEFDDVTYTINNNSSITVSFSFNDNIYSLNQDESISFTLNSSEGMFSPKEISFTGHKKSILLNRENLGTSGIFYSFTDVPRFNLEVINTLSAPVTLGETGSYIDNNGYYTLSILENGNETAFIYTSNPNFTISESYPVTFDWKFTDDTIYLVILL